MHSVETPLVFFNQRKVQLMQQRIALEYDLALRRAQMDEQVDQLIQAKATLKSLDSDIKKVEADLRSMQEKLFFDKSALILHRLPP